MKALLPYRNSVAALAGYALALTAYAVVVAVFVFGADPALASTDTTFTSPFDTVAGIVGDTGG